jgi:hypothetical protein
MAMVVMSSAAWAEITYREFHDLDKDRQGEIIGAQAEVLIEELRVENNILRLECIGSLFYSSSFNPINGTLPEGWVVLYRVIDHERSSTEYFQHGQTVEVAMRQIGELYCPVDMK